MQIVELCHTSTSYSVTIYHNAFSYLPNKQIHLFILHHSGSKIYPGYTKHSVGEYTQEGDACPLQGITHIFTSGQFNVSDPPTIIVFEKLERTAEHGLYSGPWSWEHNLLCTK